MDEKEKQTQTIEEVPQENEAPAEPQKGEAPADPQENEAPAEPQEGEAPSESQESEAPVEPQENEAPAEPQGSEEPGKKAGPAVGRLLGRILGRAAIVLLVTLVIAAGGVFGVAYILARGPSPTAQRLFVMSLRETSAVGFIADIFLSPEEIAQIEAGKGSERVIETDTSLVTVQAEEPDDNGADAWGLVDEDGDGIIIDDVKGEGYSGFMMVVKDPSRVIMGSVTDDFGIRGYTVEEMVQYFDAVAGTNAGGFVDIGGQGDGSLPDRMVVFKGEIYNGSRGTGSGFVGLDSNYILHVGLMGSQAIKDADIQYGCSFGPVLVSNGQGVDPDSLSSGVNPRTAIGQRSDGAILLLVIDGRQVISLGATYEDLVEIMLRYGAVNACNLDGGSSSMMYYNGAYVNNCASVIGIRPVPTTFLVLKEGARESGDY